MDNFEKNVTFVIVSFKSSYIIEKCIQSINSNIKIIVIENSKDIFIKKYLENKFLNVEVVILCSVTVLQLRPSRIPNCNNFLKLLNPRLLIYLSPTFNGSVKILLN